MPNQAICYKNPFSALLMLCLLSEQTVQAMHQQPNINLPAAVPRVTLCDQITHTGARYMSSIKNRLGALCSAAANKLLALRAVQSTIDTIRDCEPIIRANKEELFGCGALALATTTGLYTLTKNRDLFYLTFPIYNILLKFCENQPLAPLARNLLLQPLLIGKQPLIRTVFYLLWGGSQFRLSQGLEKRCQVLIVGTTLGTQVTQLGIFSFFGSQLDLAMHFPDIFACLFSFTTIIERTEANRTLLLAAINPRGQPDVWPNNYASLFDRSQNRRPRFAQLLIALGADVNYTGLGHHTPLQLATLTNQPQVVRALLESGAPADSATNQIPRTPLLYAVQHNRTAIVKKLLKHGADIKKEYPNSTEINDSLHYAQLLRHDEIYSLLREKRYADLAPFLKDHLKLRDVMLIVVDYE